MPEWTLKDACRWTHTGDEVLIVKCVARDGSSYNGFRWPLEIGATVEASDWNPHPECGGGLHGWPWGLSVGDGKEPDYAGTWLVFGAKPGDVVDLDGKCKAKVGVIRFVGSWDGALAFVLSGQMELVYQSASGAASATGWSGAASAAEKALAAIVTGLYGKARAPLYGCIALAWWNAAENRAEMRCAQINGREGLKPDTWYRLDAATGEFVEAKDA